MAEGHTIIDQVLGWCIGQRWKLLELLLIEQGTVTHLLGWHWNCFVRQNGKGFELKEPCISFFHYIVPKIKYQVGIKNG
jgi:hypothetical protein